MRIFLAPGATDMRKQFDGLAAAARSVVRQDPLSGAAFVFCNRRRHLLKILLWDTSGWCLFAKRLERGTFAWPEGTDPVEMRSEELALLLGGIDLDFTRRRCWYERRPLSA
jgi:transposase